MALSNLLYPLYQKTNICFDCQNACGGCSWSEINPETKKPRFEPVPGWTAQEVILNVGRSRSGYGLVHTYHITACPQFVPDEKRASNNCIVPKDWSGFDD